MEDGTEPAFSAAVLAAVLPITRREAEVLAWVATGLSNLQIARELSISVRTVIKHLEHVYSKLGVPSRAAATALAFQTQRGKDVQRAGKGPGALQAAALAVALPITPREAEVLAWVATGLSNLQIARELSISVRTVIKHLEHVYSKLGVPSRAAATALAFQTLRGGAAESASGVLDDLSGNPPEKE